MAKFTFFGCTDYNKDLFCGSARQRKLLNNLAIARNRCANTQTTYNAVLNGPYTGPYTFTPIAGTPPVVCHKNPTIKNGLL